MEDKIKEHFSGKSREEIASIVGKVMDMTLLVEALIAFVVYFLLQCISIMCADVYLAILFMLTLKVCNRYERKKIEEDIIRTTSNEKTEDNIIEST